MATFRGTSGADEIVPGSISDGVMATPPGSIPSETADAIDGLGGGDILVGGGGGDTINGGAGDDWVNSEGAGNVLHGNGGNDQIEIWITDSGGVNPATNTLSGDDGNDIVRLFYHPNLATFDWVGEGPTGTIRLYGGAGDDTAGVYGVVDTFGLNMAGTAVYLHGGDGNDRLDASSYDPNDDGSPYGGKNPDHLYGGPGDDFYRVFETTDVVIENAGQGYDAVMANSTDYTLGPNVEKLVLSYNFYDFPRPEEGRDGAGNVLDNLMIGTDLNETLDGLGGDDTIYGNAGISDPSMPDQDLIHGGAGDDVIYGGQSNDDLEDGPDTIYGDAGDDTVWAGAGGDVVRGGAGNDSLYGQSDDDKLYGGDGADMLGGGSGNDLLDGGLGDDKLTGREGLDRLYGGGGIDRFDYDYVTYSSPGTASRDVIYDFTGAGTAAGDLIDLSTIDADSGASGNQTFDFIESAAFSAAGQVRVQGSGTDSLVQANVTGTSGAEMEILVKGVAYGQWEVSDFVL